MTIQSEQRPPSNDQRPLDALLGSVARFWKSEEGTTATEYAVMIGLVLLLVILGVGSVGGGVSGWWTNIDSEMTTHGF